MKQARKKNQSPFSVASPMAQRIHEGLLLMLSAVAVFLLVSLVTYTPVDPGWTNFTTTHKVNNWGGKVGAWFADIFILLMGYIAYFFPLILLFAAVKSFMESKDGGLHKKNRFYLPWERFLRGLSFTILLASACGLAHIYLSSYGNFFPARAGGVLGYLVSQGLNQIFNLKASILFLVALFLSSITLMTGFSWLSLINKLGAWVNYGIQNLWCLLIERWKEQFSRQFDIQIKKNKRPQILDADNDSNINNKLEVKNASARLTQHPRMLDQGPLSSQRGAPIQAFGDDICTAGLTEPILKEKKKISSTQLNMSASKEALNSNCVLKPGTLPPLNLLDPPLPHEEKPFSELRFEELSQLVEQRLLDFGVEVKVTAVHPGPVITRFELELAPGIKVSKITGLAKDIARSLSVASVRVVEVIPGKSVIGLEIANENREVVSLREILESSQYAQLNSPVSLALGKDISGVPTIVDLAKMPHLLVAGTTGSGKSVSLNAMLLSMLYKAMPEQLRFILIDPKMLELSIYEGIPHLLTPVITDMKDASNALRWCVLEMDKRYRLMASLGVRSLASYNLKIQEAIKQGEPISAPAWLVTQSEQSSYLTTLPLIVVVADELADMMMVVGKKVEELVVRLAQKARAAGIHLILATQRPSVDVITGLIKANVPTRIAFQVSSRIDSRTILDQQGAEQLLGHGDMLYLPAGAGIPVRVHGAYVSDEEVHRVVAAWQTAGKPNYLSSITEEGDEENKAEEGMLGEIDPLYDQAVRIVTESRRASISLIQRRLRIGYNRAARIMEDMETAGLVSSMDSGGSREVLAEPPP